MGGGLSTHLAVSPPQLPVPPPQPKMDTGVIEGGLNVTLTIRLLMHGKVRSGGSPQNTPLGSDLGAKPRNLVVLCLIFFPTPPPAPASLVPPLGEECAAGTRPGS